MARSTILMLLCLAVFSCQKENEKPNCDQQAGRAIDVTSGPAVFLSSWGGDPWAFLSDELGGSGTAQQFTSYPLFLNYPTGCRSSYAVNVVQAVLYDEEEPDSSAALMTTYVNVPYGQAVELYDPIYRPDFPLYYQRKRSVRVTDLPETMADWQLYPDLFSLYEMAVDPVAREFQIELPEFYVHIPFCYLVIRSADSDQRYAVLLDFADGPDYYDFASEARLVHSHVIEVPECSAVVGFTEVLDAERGDVVFLEADTVENGIAKLWTVNPDAPHLLFMSIRGAENEQHFCSKLFDAIPTRVECPEKPIEQFYWTPEYLSVDLNEEGSLRVQMDKVGQRFSDHYRDIRGLLAPGRHRFNHPFLPQNLKDTFPGLALPTTLYEEGHRIDFLQFERLPNPADYPKVAEWTPAIDRYVYHRYQVDVE
ncbi:MAG: hypothetical protein AAFO03_18070 [Bacteroidota bacterium]